MKIPQIGSKINIVEFDGFTGPIAIKLAKLCPLTVSYVQKLEFETSTQYHLLVEECEFIIIHGTYEVL